MQARTPTPASERDSLVFLVALGAAMEFFYAALLVPPAYLPHHLQRQRIDMVTFFGKGPSGRVAFAGPLLVAFALYGAAFLVARHARSREAVIIIFAWAVVHALTLALMYPAGAMDVFDYAENARTLVVYHHNPLVVPPLGRPPDDLSYYVAWPTLPSPYGPLWMLVSILPAALTHGDVLRSVLAFKAVAILFYLGTGALVWLALRDRPSWRLPAVLLVIWNPLLIFEVAGNGHNDIAMAFFVMLALVLEQRELHLPAVLALTASALFKFVSLLLLPPLVVYVALNFGPRGRRELALALPLAGALGVLAYLPFWQGTETFHALKAHAGMVANSPAAVLAGFLVHSMSPPDARFLAKWVLVLAFGAGYIILLLRPVRSHDALVTVMVDAVFLYLVLAAFWFQPWYLAWLLPLAALIPDRRRALAAAAFTLSAALMYIPVDFAWQTYFLQSGPDWPHRLAVLTVFPLPVLLWIWSSGVRWPSRVEPLPEAAVAER